MVQMLNLMYLFDSVNFYLQVLSVTLDDWSDDEVDAMIEVGGNASANSIYEAYIPEGYTKPRPDASHEQRAKFIRLDMLSYTQ